MLFNSFEFVFGFLPLTLLLFFLVGRVNRTAAAAVLAIASFVFYGWWSTRYLLLLGGSIGFNYAIGWLIGRAVAAERKRVAKRWLVAGIVGNLAVLSYYKYAGFFVENLNAATGSSFSLGEIVLPLGISFFTFTQLAFLVDTYRGYVQEYRFVHYSLFVTYFPHLIAGPVLHHKEMMPQFAAPETYRPNPRNIALGLTIFAFGLFKKVVLADGISPFADHAFNESTPAAALGLFDAWGGALAYSLQLYFDFSGYSDMAVGLSLLFGIRLPLNFWSPYKSPNISEFWRRWHMTLSRFLRDYLYISLGGNRRGAFRRYVNLMTTMLLGGLWHGAGWTFVIWGGLHGLYLVVNHAWLAVKARIVPAGLRGTLLSAATARTVTLLCVIVGWVFFRAPSLGQALDVLKGMAGMHGVVLPAALLPSLGGLGASLQQSGVSFGDGSGGEFVRMFAWIGVLGAIALFAPNTTDVTRRMHPAFDAPEESSEGPFSRVHWSPDLRWSVVTGLLLVASILSMFKVSEFLYYQF